jgi:hypothetical protein
MSDSLTKDHDQQVAVSEFEFGPMRYRAEVRVTPVGILAVGVLMSAALLSTAVLVWASTSVARRRVSR